MKLLIFLIIFKSSLTPSQIRYVPVTITSGLAEYPEVLDILKVLSEKYIVKVLMPMNWRLKPGTGLQ